MISFCYFSIFYCFFFPSKKWSDFFISLYKELEGYLPAPSTWETVLACIIYDIIYDTFLDVL